MAKEILINTRVTRQKVALRQAFEKVGRPLSPEEVWEVASKQVKGLGLATVYRNIKSLVEDNVIVPVELINEAPRYEIAGKGHHHHFRCNDCDKVFELEGCIHNVEKLVPRGYKVQVHHLVFYGSCKECNS